MDNEDDICEDGWSDESFGFDECGAPATDTVFVFPGRPMRVCSYHSEIVRRLFPELNDGM
jgi:hypothetical protein